MLQNRGTGNSLLQKHGKIEYYGRKVTTATYWDGIKAFPFDSSFRVLRQIASYGILLGYSHEEIPKLCFITGILTLTEVAVSQMMPLAVKLFTDVLRDVGHATIEVHGSSMLPVILPGDILKVQAGPAEVGEIAVFLRNERVCAHRVIASNATDIVTRGDANSDPDPCLRQNEILGRVISLQRNGRTITGLEPRALTSRLLTSSALIRLIFLRVQAWRRNLKSTVLPRRFSNRNAQV